MTFIFALTLTLLLSGLFLTIRPKALLAQDISSPNRQSTETSETGRAKYIHLPRVTTETTPEEIVNHPAFYGFGRLVLPLEGSRRPPNTPLLISLANMLPYHYNVSPNQAAEALNHMIDQVARGRILFYDLYTDKEKKERPQLEATGLFFFEGNPYAPTAIICAGGGFVYVGSIHEGFPHAMKLNKKGFNAFVVKYRVDSELEACQDLARAIELAFKLSEELKISMEGYSLWGSSAGARLAAHLGSEGTLAYGARELPKPRAVIMAYTGHSELSIVDPPTFAVVGEDDAISDPLVMRRRINGLKKAGVPTEFHVFPNTRHGFGLGVGTKAEGWLDLATNFWQKQLEGK
ncbi:MAG: alpha/beta hydrolase [Deltaproteobacteria bacterium]|nr:alpha/beta hydrolase [Deltaproteobacteria bacterium]